MLIIGFKLLYSSLPFISSDYSWTLTNLSYNALTFWVLHLQRGVPYEFNQGAYDHLTLWEQIDSEAQFTPTKKHLTITPIILFLISTHYSNFTIPLFCVNIVSLIVVLVGKIPSMHKVRLLGINYVTVEE